MWRTRLYSSHQSETLLPRRELFLSLWTFLSMSRLRTDPRVGFVALRVFGTYNDCSTRFSSLEIAFFLFISRERSVCDLNWTRNPSFVVRLTRRIFSWNSSGRADSSIFQNNCAPVLFFCRFWPPGPLAVKYWKVTSWIIIAIIVSTVMLWC